MNQSTDSGGTTRRSFIKRSVVAAVAVSSLTIFSGLVNANLPGGGYPCSISKNQGKFGDGGNFNDVEILFCRAKKADCYQELKCGKFYQLDENGRVKVNPQTGQPLTELVSWSCSEMIENPFFGQPDFPDESMMVPVTKKCLP